ncbi:fucolectin-6-like [Anneissia japonica]|uniref:fucolectin-6-like n=1 Tax=Anneissia japonica TaxID=1529436 RepID=UPI0014256D9C|nr:fucolectin-6-like [Anneissia japonica]
MNDWSCTHTKNQADNWWKVDLGKHFKIKYVRLYNRQDCCKERLNGATIRVGNSTTGLLSNPQCGVVVNIADINNSNVISRQCTPETIGRYVSVSLSHDYLSLCEVEVWGDDGN